MKNQMKNQMKKNAILAIFALVFLSACQMPSMMNKNVVSKFTSVENLFQLRVGSDFNEVVSALGSKPYDILSNQLDGYKIVTYKYKVIEREIDPDRIKVNEKGNETTGSDVYNPEIKTVFLFFRNDKLDTFITSSGLSNSQSLIMLNNTLYILTRDKDKYFLIPTSMDMKEDKTGNVTQPVKDESKGGAIKLFGK